MAAVEEGSIALAYVEDIDRLVAEDFLTDALEKLLDFVRDFAPALKTEALALYAHHSRVRKALKQRTYDDQAILEGNELGGVARDIVNMAERVREIAAESAALPVSPLQPAFQPEKGEPKPDQAGDAVDAGLTLDDYRKMYVAAVRRQNPSTSENVVL